MKSSAGKLLIVGGHAQSFAAPAAAYGAAEKAGIGAARVVLPASLERTLGHIFPATDFAPSNPSGGFATNALAELLTAGEWADGVLLAGDMGRNSESLSTAENFATKYTGRLAITKDSADFFCRQPQSLLNRQETLLVISMGQLQRLGLALKLPYAFTLEAGLLQLVERLHEFTMSIPNIYLVTRQQDSYIVAVKGEVCTSPIPGGEAIWRVSVAASATTWWVQNPTKPFEAIVTSLLSG